MTDPYRTPGEIPPIHIEPAPTRMPKWVAPLVVFVLSPVFVGASVQLGNGSPISYGIAVAFALTGVAALIRMTWELAGAMP